MEYKVVYACEGEECRELEVDANKLASPIPGVITFGETRPPTIQEVVIEIRKNGGFWRGEEFVPYHNIKSIGSEKY